MIEFVTDDGHRFPVKMRNGEACAITDSHGPRLIFESMQIPGMYMIGVDDAPLYGKLRVKAGRISQ